jgi:hypothetical protein
LKAFCPGGSELFIKKGKWRSSANSTIIYDCAAEESCLGGKISECGEGYQGIFCSQCSGNKNGTIYARSSGTKCAKCSSFGTQITFILLTFFIAIIYVAYIIK